MKILNQTVLAIVQKLEQEKKPTAKSGTLFITAPAAPTP